MEFQRPSNIIPAPWAENGQYETIPATQVSSGRASWDTGFPLENTIPVSSGGIPANYNDFQGVLHDLSEHTCFQQTGGLYLWSSSIDYPVGAVVQGSDNGIYRALAKNGPNTTVANPVTDSSGKWTSFVMTDGNQTISGGLTVTSGATISGGMTVSGTISGTATDASSLGGVAASGYVTTSGAQTISGEKKFTANVTIENNSNPCLVINRSSGGTGTFTDLQYQIAGTIKAHVRKTDEYLRIGSVSTAAPTGIFTGPNLLLYEAGNFRLVARNNNTERILEGKDNGTLTWLGNTIQTSSDERLKTAFSSVPDAILDAWGEVSWQQFKFRDAVAEKGEENCRWHPGLVAQRVKAVFEREGLDACAYGILCHEEWQDEYAEDENGERILQRPAGDVWMVRYEEALAMEAACQRRRADRAEARITTLEQRLGELEAALASLISPISEEQTAEPEE